MCAWGHVRFSIEARNVVDYAVVLLVKEREESETVRVYDGTHGVNELHRYTHKDGKQAAEIFHSGTLGMGMRAAIDEIKRNYPIDHRRVAKTMNTDNHMSPAVQVMDEAIELAIEECSPYPDRAMFIDADASDMGKQINRALEDDMAIVLVFADHSTRTLYAEPVTG